MIYISFITCIVLIVFIVVARMGKNGKWSCKNINRLFLWMRRRGKKIPNWIDEKFIIQSWMILFLGNVTLGVCSYCFGLEIITKLEKPTSGTGSVWEDVEVVWKDENGKEHTEQFQIKVNEQQMEEKEIEKQFSEIKSILQTKILGENESLDFVNKPLYMPEQLENYNADISWSSDSPWIVQWDGTLGDDIPEEGVCVNLTATIWIQEEEDTVDICVTVYPKEYSWLEDLKTVLDETKSESSWLELPSEWNGIAIKWKKDKNLMLVFMTGVVFGAPVLMFFKKKQDIEEEEKRKRKQMLQDYPEIISKLMLLLSAGMSLRRAMEKIVADYKKYQELKEKRAAYELLADTCREINCGVTEIQAYENLGERCELLQYKTLSALLVQHLQKGNKGMEQMLTEEVRRTQELRQQQARIMGEQASAKLLFPMMLMLLDVFIILIVPAWSSFSI